MFFHARFERHLLRGVSMLMQYLPTTATSSCFSTLLIHSRIDAFTFKILIVLWVIFDLQGDGKLRYSCTDHDTNFTFALLLVFT